MELLTKSTILSAFADIARKLRERTADGEMYVVGGAAVALAYDKTRLTRDVDARLDAERNALLDAATEVAADRGWDRTWLNEEPWSFIPTEADSGETKVFEQSGLVVRAASPRRLIAMKMLAGRPQDVYDMALLLPLEPDLCTEEDLITLAKGLGAVGIGDRHRRFPVTARKVLDAVRRL